MAIFGLALAGTACAVGYRNMFDGSVSPTLPPSIKAINERNTIPSVSDPQAASSGNTREVGPATTGSIDNMISREEPTSRGWAPKSRPARFAAPGKRARDAGRRSGGAETSGAARSGAAPPAASSYHCRCPAAPRPIGRRRRHSCVEPRAFGCRPCRTCQCGQHAAVTAPVVASGYAVQVTSERSESRAQAAFRALQAKYPNQLSGHQPIIRRADLGAAGIYYRALVGPFASAEKATKMCSALKAAGGDCIIQKN